MADFAPSLPAGLVAWYDPMEFDGFADGEAISCWHDKSGRGRDLRQALTARQPRYRAPSGPRNLLAAPESTFEEGIARSRWTVDAKNSIDLSGKWAYHGARSLRVTTPTAAWPRVVGPSIKLDGPGSIYGEITTKGSVAGRRLILGLEFTDFAGAVTRSFYASSLSSTDPVRLTVSGDAPRGVSFVRLSVQVKDVAKTDEHLLDAAAIYWNSLPARWKPPIDEPGRRPVIQFDGYQQVLETNSFSIPQPCTEFLVAGYTSPTALTGPLAASTMPYQRRISAVGGVLGLNAGANLLDDLPAGPTRLVTARCASASSELRVNGVSRRGAIGTAGRTGIRLGADGTGKVFAAAEVCELLIFDRLLSAVETEGVERYLSEKHQIPLLSWSDDFNGPAGSLPNPLTWDYDVGVGGNGWGNNELQTYTFKRPENVCLDGNGNLKVTARRETYSAWDDVTRSFTSGRVKTLGGVSTQYGEFVARIFRPTGPGLWPAFWMLGDDIPQVGWPACGEVDIMETVNDGTRMGCGIVAPTSGGGRFVAERSLTDSTFGSGWHTHSLRWSPDELTVRIDGRVVGTFLRDSLPIGATWVFDKPFHMLLNLAVGGNYAGGAVPAASFESASMLVDFVRIYSF